MGFPDCSEVVLVVEEILLRRVIRVVVIIRA